MICSSVNRDRFIVRPHSGPDSNPSWRKIRGSGHRSHILLHLLSHCLIASFDVSASQGELGRTYSIFYSGTCHLRFALNHFVFFEQMALTSIIYDQDVAAQIRQDWINPNRSQRNVKRIQDRFAQYLIKQDSKFINDAPDVAVYESQQLVLRKIKGFLSPTRSMPLQQDVETKQLSGYLDRFHKTRRFGFLRSREEERSIYFSTRVVEPHMRRSILVGDEVLFDATDGEKGLCVLKINSIAPMTKHINRLIIYVTRVFLERRYGFTYSETIPEDILFRHDNLSGQDLNLLAVGNRLEADIFYDPVEKSYEVREIFRLVSST
ncbi:MAG: hypothetical protein EAZ99_18465 [Alphaproteobacteria bacterium]|nr:MAG: hypothetical protein EAZ99_18465 [Alphaproteobacteria bacterium]